MEFDQSLGLKRDTLFDTLFLYVTTGMFALTIVLATVQVFVRIFEIGILGTMYWTEPAARFVLIVATYWGAAIASRNDEHIRMNYVLEKLEDRYPRLRSAFEVLATAIVIFFVLIALRGSIRSTIANWHTSIGGIGFVTSGVLYFGISIGLAVMLVYEGSNLLEWARAVIGYEDTGDTDTQRSADAGSITHPRAESSAVNDVDDPYELDSDSSVTTEEDADNASQERTDAETDQKGSQERERGDE